MKHLVKGLLLATLIVSTAAMATDTNILASQASSGGTLLPGVAPTDPSVNLGALASGTVTGAGKLTVTSVAIGSAYSRSALGVGTVGPVTGLVVASKANHKDWAKVNINSGPNGVGTGSAASVSNADTSISFQNVQMDELANLVPDVTYNFTGENSFDVDVDAQANCIGNNACRVQQNGPGDDSSSQ